MGLKKTQEREYAKLLYVNDRLDFKVIAERVGVSPKSVSKWAEEDKWDDLRKSLLTTRQSQLVHWYNQLNALNESIALRDTKIPTNGEADTMSKIVSNIQRLEVETNLGEYIEVGRKVLMFVQESGDLEAAKMLTRYFDEFISSKLKHS